ncbi:nicotinate-nucleotide--dimethylbenzimidazole phosphoribosyltransferase [Streptomyces griseus]|uniref:nicotinate-nucleotide--dimethylbenzimidazole phosphoribosyltransferase n=1 Tax=Streptomyces griseus TaxID=1911 RepID=UPI0008408395|nr:nicotinate-nucleotide--dimethylbenzimidazole phosphoribosyltransferase [Streptomyces griseus]
MTDTGRIPGEGLPENAGMVEQPGVPAPDAHTFLEPSEQTPDDDLLLMPAPQGAWSDAPAGQSEPQPRAHARPSADRTAGGAHGSGATDVGAVRIPAPAQVPVAAHAAPAARRRPHRGPASPEAPSYGGTPSGGVVRSLADRGPAGAPQSPTPVRHVVPPTTGPEYVGLPADDGARLPGPQLGEIPPQGGTPWGAQPPEAAAQAVPAAQAEAGAQPEPAVQAGPGFVTPAEPVVQAGPGSVAESGEPAVQAEPPVQAEPAFVAAVEPAVHAGPETAAEPVVQAGPEAVAPAEPVAAAQPVAAAEPATAPEAVPAPAADAVPDPAPVPVADAVPAPAPQDASAPAAAPVPPAETVVPEPVAPVEPDAVEKPVAEPVATATPDVPAGAPAEAAVATADEGPLAPLEVPAPAAENPTPAAVPLTPTDPAEPVRPEAVEAVAAPVQVPPAADVTPEPAAVPAPQAAQAAEAAPVAEAPPAAEAAPVAEDAPQAPVAVEEPSAAPEPEPEAPEAQELPAPAATVQPEPVVAPEPTPAAAPEPVAEAAPVVQPEPVVAPEPVPAAAPEPVAEAAPVVDPEPVVEPEPVPVPQAEIPAPAESEAGAGPEIIETPEAEVEEAVSQEAGDPQPVPSGTGAPSAEGPASPDPETATPETQAPEAAPSGTQVPEAGTPENQAIEAEEFHVAADEAPATPPAPGYDDAEREAVLRVMRERRDIRNGFRSDPIPHEVLLRVLEAAHTAPSVGHSQPWDFVVIRSAETRRSMHELAQRQRDAYAKSLPKARAKQFKELKIEAILDTPVNIVVTADPTRGGRHTLGRHTQPQMAPYSSALAVENLWLAARAEGLGVGWVSFFDEREMVRALGLPEHLEVVAYLCVGYVDEFPEEPELMQAGWSKRRPLSWVVHEETYGRRALPGEEPHDLLQETIANIRPLDAKALGEAWERQKRMTKPAGALGMLEIISAQLSGLSRKCPPPIPEPAAVAIFAGDHGVHAQGVTAWPQEVTAQMVANFLGGGAVCNAFAAQVGAEVCVVDVGVAAELPATPGLLPRKVRPGTADFTTGPALTRDEVLAAIEVGIETARDLVAAGNKGLLTGEMGIANTTASAALICVYTGMDPAEVTGRGTGINDEMHARKVDVVRRALELHQPDPADPIGVLAAVGGLEHAAMAGFLLGGASLRTPVILDGVSAGAAALVARAIAPEALAACIAGHRSAEPGHVAALNKLGLRPLVDLDLRLGEGTGALLALPIVQSAARAMHEVATFDSAGVTEK